MTRSDFAMPQLRPRLSAAVRRVAPIGLAAALVVAGCAPAHRKAPVSAGVTAPSGWVTPSIGEANAVDPQWWHAFRDPELAAAVEAALTRNTDLLIAATRVEQAEAVLRLVESDRRPTVLAVGGAQAERTLAAAGVTTVRALEAGAQVNWELDLWGRLRHEASAAELQLRATRADRDAVALLVATTTARVYLGLLAFEAQLNQARDTAVSRAEALRLEEDKLRVGYISQLQFTQAQSEYQAVQQAIPQLQLAISRQHNILRLLTGDLPAVRSAMARSFHDLQVPIPSTVLPSDLLRRRPDIAHAELQLAATDASLAARRAEFLPQVSLTGNISGLFVNALQYNPITVWSVGGSILAPIFNRDRLRAEFDAVAAQRDAAAFAYRGAALAAFSEVESALAGQLYFAEQLDHVLKRREVLRQSLEHARNRYQAGYAPYLDQLDAQRNLYQVENEAIAVHQSQLENVVDLYKALGGGWDVARVNALRPDEVGTGTGAPRGRLRR